MKKLSVIQSGVRRHGKDDGINLTTDEGRENTNRILRSFSSALAWPELRRTDTSLSTAATNAALTGIFTWPEKFVLLNILAVEIQDGDDGNKYKAVTEPPTEQHWRAAEHKEPQSVPDHYQLLTNENGLLQLELRATPKHTGKTIRLTGKIEPAFTGAESASPFRLKTADDALEMLIAADYLEVEGPNGFSDRLISRAGQLLRSIFGAEAVPAELPAQIIRG